jgi:4-diphosphocytidyl-2-C-methyl-D-erythritol kinase
MITFPNAKINLGLNIVEKRTDGYHNLETVFYPVPLEDALEVIVAERAEGVTLSQTGIVLAGDSEDNLVVKAYRLLEREGYRMPAVDIFLHKGIPSGAGMGGGSADATFMLRLLNTNFSLGISDELLENYSSRLGADCAFFVKNQPTFAEGIGDVFSPVRVSLKGYRIVIVKPDIFVSTREAFSKVTPRRAVLSPREVVQRPVEEWRELLHNDFETSVFAIHPEIGKVKQQLYDAGAVYASMSGSGSSLFGLFAPGSEPVLPTFPEGSFQFSAVLK